MAIRVAAGAMSDDWRVAVVSATAGAGGALDVEIIKLSSDLGLQGVGLALL